MLFWPEDFIAFDVIRQVVDEAMSQAISWDARGTYDAVDCRIVVFSFLKNRRNVGFSQLQWNFKTGR